MFKSVNSIFFYVDDIDHGISFYEAFKGLHLLWKKDNMAGLGIEEDITEIILKTNQEETGVCFEVDNVSSTIDQLTMMGGVTIKDPFSVSDGKMGIVRDPFGNVFFLHDNSDDKYLYDDDGNIVAEKKQDLINKLSHFILEK